MEGGVLFIACLAFHIHFHRRPIRRLPSVAKNIVLANFSRGGGGKSHDIFVCLDRFRVLQSRGVRAITKTRTHQEGRELVELKSPTIVNSWLGITRTVSCLRAVIRPNSPIVAVGYKEAMYVPHPVLAGDGKDPFSYLYIHRVITCMRFGSGNVAVTDCGNGLWSHWGTYSVLRIILPGKVLTPAKGNAVPAYTRVFVPHSVSKA